MELVREQLLFLISTPLYLFFIGGEILLSYFHNRHFYTTRGTLMNVWLSAINLGLDLLLRGFVLVFLGWFMPYKLVQIETPWIYWTVLMLAEDFLFYWLHRVDHYCRLFWAVHVTHHSSEEFNLTVGFRSSVFQPFYRFIWFIPLPVLGFRPEDVMLMYAITQIYGILIHTQFIGKLGPLEWIFSTPSHHRVHHASNVEYLDKNMGMVLIIWDRLFGTFAEEKEDEPVRYGLTKNLPNAFDPVNTVVHEWKDIFRDQQQPLTVKERLGYLFGPPGWSHDGSRKTSKQLREELNRRK
ncbi:MAG: sterol desaturase family protein [Bacteroidia bacterium]|jgi:sterol desaturase/sphingolipid hydroxylase (fatty acid hydroxylase superfamily)|nr:sterol desaturase family protein [Bacteroidia bacterium]